MEEIKESDIIGTWKEVRAEYKGQQEASTNKYSEYYFREDQQFEPTYVVQNVRQRDRRERRWELKAPQDPQGSFVIVINDEPAFRIISLNEKEMSVEASSSRTIYYLEKMY